MCAKLNMLIHPQLAIGNGKLAKAKGNKICIY